MDTAMSEQDSFLQQLLDMMNNRMSKIEDKLDANTAVTQQILTQAKYTNGRVTKLEKQQADAQNIKAAKKFNLSPNVIYLLALGAVILLAIVAVLLKIPIGGLL